MNQDPLGTSIIKAISTVVLTLLLFIDATTIAVSQTVTGDGTVGTAVELNNQIYQITDGKKEGANLFHSFEKFGLEAGFIADFKDTLPGPTNNIFSRVTGGDLSAINGKIRSSSISGANFYLINPAGIMFGENASLDVGGSFYASTAYEVRFEGDRFTFSTSDLENLRFSSALPKAFGFLDGENQVITVQGPILETNANENLALIGHSVAIDDAALTAGTINIVSVGKNSKLQISGGVIEELTTHPEGSVTITNESHVKANHIRVLGGNITINESDLKGPSNAIESIGNDWLAINGNTVALGMYSNIGALDEDIAPWGNVRIDSKQNATIGAKIGTKGNIIVTGESRLDFSGALFRAVKQKNADNGNIEISTEGKGIAIQTSVLQSVIDLANKPTKVGNITILAKNGNLAISKSTIDNDSPEGVAGSTMILIAEEGNLSIDNSAIVSRTAGEENAGDIIISAKSLNLDPGTRILGEVATGRGRGADIRFSADDVRLEGATIRAENAEDAAGDAGNITLEIGDVLHLQGGSIISTSNKGGTGDGGDINISRRDSSITDSFILTLDDSSNIEANTDQGRGGDINIDDVVFFGPRQNITAFARGSEGVDGVIKIIGPDGDILSGVTVLPESYFENEVALQPPCGAAMENTSGFVVHSAGGMPPTPDAFLASSPGNARSSVNKSNPSSKGPDQDGSFFIREVSHQTRDAGACAPTN